MPNIVNRLVVQELSREFADADGLLVVSFNGLTVEESEALRTRLSEQSVKFRMVRNKLARRVLAERGLEFAEDVFLGNTAVAYGRAEATIGAAKILTDKDVKKTGKVQVKGGALEGNVLGAQDANALADVPDRDTLNAMLLGTLNGPARGLVGVINAPLASIARLLQARADQLAEAGQEPVDPESLPD